MAFQAVTDAGIRSGIAQTDARSYRDRKLNEAEGNAAARINVARAESNDMVAKIKGDAAIFNNVLPSYRRNPELFTQRHIVETLGRAIATVDYKMYLPTSADGKPVELRLNLNREPIKQGSTETKR